MSPGRPAWGQPRARWWGETPSDRCRREGRLRGDGGGKQSRLDEKGPPSPATVGFTRPIFPSGDPGSPAAFLGGGMGRGWSADSGPGSLAASSCPAVDWLAVCPWAGYTPRSLSFSICKTGVTNAEPIDPTGQCQARACHRQVRDALCLSLPSFSRAALSQFLRRGCGLSRSALYIHEFWVQS